MARDDSDSDAERSESELSGDESDDELDDQEEEEEEEEDDEDEQLAAEAKHKLVEADVAEIKKMMEEMDKIKMRLQFRLAREQENSSEGSSSRRRSSVEEIFVPPTVTAAVQTTWDMSRMFEMEKVISSAASAPSVVPVPEAHVPDVPVGPSAQLSLADLARSYGVQDAVVANDESPLRMSLKPPSNMDGYAPQSVRPLATKAASSKWDGLVMTGSADTNSILGHDSVASPDKPSKLHRSQLNPTSVSDARAPTPVALNDSFGAPSSPIHSVAGSHAAENKTMEQKEMEAMKGLLFF